MGRKTVNVASPALEPPSMVAARIRELRSDMGLNQTEFAKAIGMSRSYISDIENLNATVSVDVLFNITKIFGEKSRKAGLLYMLTGDDRPVPWGKDPEHSRLNSVLGLDLREVAAALEAVDSISNTQATPVGVDLKARLFRQAMYVYVSEVERARQEGVEISEARRRAVNACRSLGESFG